MTAAEFSPIKPGMHIVLVCCRCTHARLTLPAANHLTIDDACERAKHLRWSFQPDGETEDGAVVCPSCSKLTTSEASGRRPGEGSSRGSAASPGQPAASSGRAER